MFAGRIYAAVVMLAVFTLGITGLAHAESSERWRSITLDNDVFLGDDSGYTNGLFFSGFNTHEGDYDPKSHLLLRPLLWTLPANPVIEFQAEGFTFGQMLSTPNDISLLDPPLDEPPYGALLFYRKSYVLVANDYADQISTTLGVVGPVALGEQAQTLVHEITGSEPPLGWDTQIGDEVVFEFSRGRLWRNWVSGNGRADFLTTVAGQLGTLQTAVSSALYLRYGRGLKRSFPTPILSGSRISNPIAVNDGWYVYAGLSAGARLRMILLDGNHFRESRSIDYRKEYLGVTVGATYAWKQTSFTFAASDTSVLQQLNDEKLDKVTQFGSMTFAWKLGNGSSGVR